MDFAQLPILLVVVPLLSSFLIPIIGLKSKKVAQPIVAIAITFSLICSVLVAEKVWREGPMSYHLGGWDPPWGIAYEIDHLGAFMVLLVSFIALLISFYSRASIAKESPGKEVPFFTIFLLLFAGLMGMVVTGDMFNLYVFLEISSLTAYALIAIGDKRATFASFKYVVIGTVGACFYLIGVGYLYMVTGSLNMHDLAQRLPELYQSKAVLVAVILFTVGICLKMGLFPLHTWLPGAYAHAPSAVSAYIAPLMTKVGAYAFIRVMFTVFDPMLTFQELPLMEILSWIAACAIIYGSIIAISKSDIKKMLAYSSISQVGYIVLGISMGNRDGFLGGVLHILNHAFMKGCLFAAVGAIIYRQGTRTIEELGMIHKKMPLTAAAFAVAALSMVGIPPTAGFFSKWYLISGAVAEQNWIFVGVILASSLLNAIYFFKVIEIIYWKPQSEKTISFVSKISIQRNDAPGTMLIPTLVLAGGIMVLGLASFWIVKTLLEPAIPPGIL